METETETDANDTLYQLSYTPDGGSADGGVRGGPCPMPSTAWTESKAASTSYRRARAATCTCFTQLGPADLDPNTSPRT